MLPECADLLKKYQNPLEADTLLKVQRDLDEVKQMFLFSVLFPFGVLFTTILPLLGQSQVECLSAYSGQRRHAEKH